MAGVKEYTKSTKLQGLINIEEENTDEQQNKLWKFLGLLCLVVHVFLIVTSQTCVTLLERRIPDFELNTLRTGCELLVFVLILVYRRELPAVPRSQIVPIFFYGVLNVTTSTFTYTSVTLISVSSAESIRKTSGVVLGIIWSCSWNYFIHNFSQRESHFAKDNICNIMCFWSFTVM